MAIVRIIPGRSLNEWNINGADLLSQFLGADNSRSDGEGSTWTPRADVSETADNYQLILELPGMQQDNIRVNFEDSVLSIEGQRELDKHEGQRVLRSESHYGKFSRSFRLNNRIAADGISAEYRHGLLTITLPKAEDAKPREINISTNGRSKK